MSNTHYEIYRRDRHASVREYNGSGGVIMRSVELVPFLVISYVTHRRREDRTRCFSTIASTTYYCYYENSNVGSS